jgi:hypothetical protein
MTVKLALLKSGEDIIADIKEMVVGDEENPKVVGYFFNKPCAVRMRNPQEILESDEKSFQVALFPWIPISKDSTIPVPSDWVVTIVEPIDKLTEMYKNQVLNYGKEDDKDTSTNEQSDSDQSN